jgi:hypothetical protein
VVAFHASRPGFDVPADLVRVNHAIGTNHEVVTEQYRNVIARVIERCYGCLARCISHDIGRFPSANHAPRSPNMATLTGFLLMWRIGTITPIMGDDRTPSTSAKGQTATTSHNGCLWCGCATSLSGML